MHISTFILKTGAQAVGGVFFGPGISVMPILFTDAQCNGSEKSLANCSISNVTGQCTHSMDAGVRCRGPVGPCEAANLTSCCRHCESITRACHCDHSCYRAHDCCSDTTNTCPECMS